MTQVAQPQVHVSILRSHRTRVLAALAALVASATALALVIAIDSSPTATVVPRPDVPASPNDAGPAAGTASAVAQAIGSERIRAGISLTTNVPALPSADGGPARGTVSAVSRALRGPVGATARADAGPAPGTPAAVRDALAAQ